MKVIVTGATGNLGGKLFSHLAMADWCDEVVGIDNRPAAAQTALPKSRNVIADLTDPTDRRWLDTLAGASALVHFATRNPLPNCTWDEATESLAMTSGLIDAALAADIPRFVFASSNHVMGGYKDQPLAGTLTPGSLTTAMPPQPGTRTTTNGVSTRPNAYATSKLYGEALAVSKARASGGRLTSVSVRIGWCLPGDNDPSAINALALPLPPAEAEAANRANPGELGWFRGMWLSNRDLAGVMERAIRADTAAWPAAGIVVNGMSANTGSVWDIATTRKLIGYVAQDDWTRVIKA
jgi:nucleoside-diphosphate-sugar epimerase